MKGVPIRLEIGPKDIENNQCVLVRRDTGDKEVVSLEGVGDQINQMLDDIHNTMLLRAFENRQSRTFTASNTEELKNVYDNKQGFVKTMWCGDRACEEKMKEDFGVTIRCIPFEQEKLGDTCVCCGRPANKMIYLGKQY